MGTILIYQNHQPDSCLSTFSDSKGDFLTIRAFFSGVTRCQLGGNSRPVFGDLATILGATPQVTCTGAMGELSQVFLQYLLLHGWFPSNPYMYVYIYINFLRQRCSKIYSSLEEIWWTKMEEIYESYAMLHPYHVVHPFPPLTSGVTGDASTQCGMAELPGNLAGYL